MDIEVGGDVNKFAKQYTMGRCLWGLWEDLYSCQARQQENEERRLG